MKKLILMVVMVSFVVLGFGRELRIAYVDSQAVYNASKDKQTAEAIYQKEVEKMQKQLEIKYNELLQLNKNLKEQASFLSKEEAQKKQQELLKKQDDFNKLREQLGQKAQKRKVELMKPLLEKIKKVVDEIRIENKYDIVLDKAAVLSGSSALDITDKVIARLNK